MATKIPIFDIHQAAFLSLNNIPPSFVKSGTRVVFQFNATREVSNLLDLYNKNPTVPLLEFVNHLRKLRGQMLSLRG